MEERRWGAFDQALSDLYVACGGDVCDFNAYAEKLRAVYEADLHEVARRAIVVACGISLSTFDERKAQAAQAVRDFLKSRNCDNCGGDVPRHVWDGTPVYPTSHGSSVGLCQECAREAISL